MRNHQLLLGITFLAFCSEMTGQTTNYSAMTNLAASVNPDQMYSEAVVNTQVRFKDYFPEPINGNTFVIAHRGVHNGSFSCPSVIQSVDGRIHITYSYQLPGGKKSIKHMAIKEEWITDHTENK